MSIPNKIYLTLGGGLGDVIFDYTSGKRGWDKIEAIKQKYPKTIIKVMASTHNPQTLELLKCNPYIDFVEEFGWQPDGEPLFAKHAKDFVSIQKIKDKLGDLPSRSPIVYLNDEDKKTVDEIISCGPFIFAHLFAGLKDRQPYSPEQYVPLIEDLLKQHINIAVIGGSHTRNNIGHPIEMVETFDYNKPGVFNLVNKTNVRVALSLAKQSRGFMGCWSCFSVYFWRVLDKKSATIISTRKRPELETKIWYKQKSKEPQRTKEPWYETGKHRLFFMDLKERDQFDPRIHQTILDLYS